MNELLAVLNKYSKHLHQWSVLKRTTHREESYLIQDPKNICNLDQNRSVFDEEFWLSIWVLNKGVRIGSITSRIYDFSTLETQLDKLIEKALLSSEEFWGFPKPTASNFNPQSCFPGFKSDLNIGSQYFIDECIDKIRKTKGASFNSAEIFISRIEEERYLSTGFNDKYLRSKIYSEVCFSAEDDRDSNEYMLIRMGVHPEQINFAQLCEDSVFGARALLSAQPMPSGNYNVKFDAETLAHIFADAVQTLDANRKYYQLPFKEKGSVFIPEYIGDKFELSLDPTIEYGFGTKSFDSVGALQKPIKLVTDNKVFNNLVDTQMSQYLNIDPTSHIGNLVLELKSGHSNKDLNGIEYLDLMQFSALSSNSQDLTFSSEVRLAEHVSAGGKRCYVKGGNLSGKFQENLKAFKASNQKVFMNLNEESLGVSMAYSGPAWGLLNTVTVSA